MCSIWPSPKIHNLLGNGNLWQVTRTLVAFLFFDRVWYVPYLIIFQQLLQHGDVATCRCGRRCGCRCGCRSAAVTLWPSLCRRYSAAVALRPYSAAIALWPPLCGCGSAAVAASGAAAIAAIVTVAIAAAVAVAAVATVVAAVVTQL